MLKNMRACTTRGLKSPTLSFITHVSAQETRTKLLPLLSFEPLSFCPPPSPDAIPHLRLNSSSLQTNGSAHIPGLPGVRGEGKGRCLPPSLSLTLKKCLHLVCACSGLPTLTREPRQPWAAETRSLGEDLGSTRQSWVERKKGVRAGEEEEEEEKEIRDEESWGCAGDHGRV